MTQSKLWKVGRSDYVVATVGVWVVMLVGVVALVTPPLVSWASGDPLTVMSRAEQVGPAVPELRATQGVEVTYTDDVVWTLDQPTTAQWMLSLVPGLLTSLALVIGGLAVLHAIRNARRGSPFTASSIRDLRVLGLLVVLGYAIIVAVVGLAVQFLLVAGSKLDVALVTDLDPPPVVVFVIGLLLVLLADVFGRGARLEADVDGLV